MKIKQKTINQTKLKEEARETVLKSREFSRLSNRVSALEEKFRRIAKVVS
jgi:phage FluMu protein Com